MSDLADPKQAVRARARLALRAEQAWGVAALTGFVPAEPVAAAAVEIQPAAAAASQGRAQERAARRDAESPDSPEIGPFADPPLPRARRIELLATMDESEVRSCALCPLGETRTRTVFGEGDPEARLMFIGEGPGENEDLTGRPFVGRAGQKLEEMINAMGLSRQQVYIANVVKCRPPGNRVPTQQEVHTCTAYLHRQIEWIRPQVIVTLGLPATRHLLRSALPMARLRGQWTSWRGIRVMPTYHPAYLLRAYTPENRRAIWSDLQKVMTELGLALARGAHAG